MSNNENEDPRTIVRISEITEEGFWVHTYSKDYYISRKKYPWFKDATDEEIRDVSFMPDAGDHHVNILFWHALGIDFDEESIIKPELIYHAILVRCVKRRDLFEGYTKDVVVQ